MGHIDNFETYAMESWNAKMKTEFVWASMMPSHCYDRPEIYAGLSDLDFPKMLETAQAARRAAGDHLEAEFTHQAYQFLDIDSRTLLQQPKELTTGNGDATEEAVYDSALAHCAKMLAKITSSRSFDLGYHFLTSLYNHALEEHGTDDERPETEQLLDTFRIFADGDGELPKDFFESWLDICRVDSLKAIRFVKADAPEPVKTALSLVGDDLAEMLKLKYSLWLVNRDDVKVHDGQILLAFRHTEPHPDGGRAIVP